MASEMNLNIRAYLSVPARILSELNYVHCESCAFFRDCGYMDITADRMAETHSDQTGHRAYVEHQAAEPLTFERIKKRISKRSVAGTKIVDI